ncbi:MAG: glycine cleavage system protein GcvH [Actinobacteria bacterium]|nr:glycine cleavage system protein GcvH [Actinomycetota bacterium]
MNVPEQLFFTAEHEWVRDENGLFRIGITDYAQDALGDIVFVALPSVGDELHQHSTFGEVESTKSVSEIYAPVQGRVVEVNGELETAPELLNSDPYGAGWLVVIQPIDLRATETLLDAEAYRALTEG